MICSRRRERARSLVERALQLQADEPLWSWQITKIKLIDASSTPARAGQYLTHFKFKAAHHHGFNQIYTHCGRNVYISLLKWICYTYTFVCMLCGGVCIRSQQKRHNPLIFQNHTHWRGLAQCDFYIKRRDRASQLVFFFLVPQSWVRQMTSHTPQRGRIISLNVCGLSLILQEMAQWVLVCLRETKKISRSHVHQQNAVCHILMVEMFQSRNIYKSKSGSASVQKMDIDIKVTEYVKIRWDLSGTF